MIKRILLVILAAFVVAQFIRPDRSAPPIDPVQDMLALTAAPADVRDLVVGACYDCHSYATQYPWYGQITPFNFIMQNHINEGREKLNFSLWSKYAGSEEAGECGEMVQEGEMPPVYYRFMHAHGELSTDQQQRLIMWFNGLGGGGGASGEQTEETERTGHTTTPAENEEEGEEEH